MISGENQGSWRLSLRLGWLIQRQVLSNIRALCYTHRVKVHIENFGGILQICYGIEITGEVGEIEAVKGEISDLVKEYGESNANQ